MRTLALAAALAATWLGAASPARAQGIDPDKLQELIEEVTRQPAAPKQQQAAPRARGKAKAPPPEVVAARQVQAALNGNAVTVNFIKTSFLDVLDFLRDVTGLNIVLSQEATKQFGEAEVTLRLKDVKLKSCLNLVLDQVSPALKYGVKHGVLWIALDEEWKKDRKMVLEVYDVSDLVRKRPDFKAPRVGLGKDGLEIDD